MICIDVRSEIATFEAIHIKMEFFSIDDLRVENFGNKDDFTGYERVLIWEDEFNFEFPVLERRVGWTLDGGSPEHFVFRFWVKDGVVVLDVLVDKISGLIKSLLSWSQTHLF